MYVYCVVGEVEVCIELVFYCSVGLVGDVVV